MNTQTTLNILIAILLTVFFNEIKRISITVSPKLNAVKTISWNG